jgi:leucyl-tRNA synthetase
LARAEDWKTEEGYRLEYNTMPGWAGSSWYFLRYMDPDNEESFVSRDKVEQWGQVDLYIGGSEHATGHLLYARFWTKFFYDRGWIPFDEPFKKLLNQGMIVGTSYRVYVNDEKQVAISAGIVDEGKEGENGEDPLGSRGIQKEELRQTFAHIDLVSEEDALDVEGFLEWCPDYQGYRFIREADGKFRCRTEVDKMSKSRFNVVNPDDLIERFGADTLRLYEMFLGPLEQSKPWDTKGIEGASRFLNRFWSLFQDGEDWLVTEEEADDEELKLINRCIHDVREDLERYSFNTVVSHFMKTCNELRSKGCHKREVLEPFVKSIAPFAPHICEELWERLGRDPSVMDAPYPVAEESYLQEEAVTYPVSFNGKTRFTIELPTDLSKEEIEKEVLASEQTAHYLKGQEPKKVIVVPNKIVNVVV